jgi:hypothetical protein
MFSVLFARPCIGGEQSIVLTDPHGFLAPYADRNYMTEGSELCTWELQAKPGQRINVTLLNLFTSASEQGLYPRAACPLRITVSEGSAKHIYELCDLNAPSRLFTSKGHVIYVKVPYSVGKADVVIQKLLRYDGGLSVEFYTYICMFSLYY